MMNNNGNYDLRLPQEKMQLFQTNKYIILNECVQLLLGDGNVSNNQTFYPAVKIKKSKNKQKAK